jgi:acetyltransferase-like isoleucine patch superfamily enzyme
MPNDDRIKIIHRRTPESAAMLANVKRAMAITATLNRLTFNDADEIRALFSELIRKKVDESFLLIPPFYTAGGDEIRVGHNVFVNQNCTFYDLGGLDIADDVMIGPNVSIITASHPLEPSQRRTTTIGNPIAIEKGVWIAAGATLLESISQLP